LATPRGEYNMGYEINVSQNGRHLFATHERSMSTKSLEQALDMMHMMTEKFPKRDGYRVTMTECATYRTDITPEEA